MARAAMERVVAVLIWVDDIGLSMYFLEKLNCEKMDPIEEAFAEFTDTVHDLDDARAFVSTLEQAVPGDSLYDEIYAEFADQIDPHALVQADIDGLVS